MTESDKDRQTSEADGESDLASLLRVVGPRVEPPQGMQREVRSALQAEWESVVRQRRVRRTRVAGWALVAGLFAAAVGLWFAGPPFVAAPPETIGTVLRVAGEVRAKGAADSAVRSLAAGETLHPGDELTIGTGAAAIELEHGIAVRLDMNTRLTFAQERLVLKEGAAYVEAGAGASPWPIETPLGTVRHLGTRYEVRLIDGALRVSVREGRVETFVRLRNTRYLTAAGERLAVFASGEVAREDVASCGPQWDWTGRTVAPLVIDRRPLTEFVAAVGRELGCEIVFANPAAETEARAVVLRGNPVDLPPRDALAAVLSTTRLKSIGRDDRILIELDR
jgi:hypothetical protein